MNTCWRWMYILSSAVPMAASYLVKLLQHNQTADFRHAMFSTYVQYFAINVRISLPSGSRPSLCLSFVRVFSAGFARFLWSVRCVAVGRPCCGARTGCPFSLVSGGFGLAKVGMADWPYRPFLPYRPHRVYQPATFNHVSE